MYKRLFGILVMVALIGVFIFNILESNNDTAEDVNSNGATIVSPDATEEYGGIEPGEEAPDFDLETLSGGSAKLSDYRGKKVILNFWASWCGPCKKEMPEMQDFYEEYQDEVEIVAVNLTWSEKNEKKVENFIDQYNYTYPILLDKDMKVSNDTYMAYALPTTYFIGTDGKIQQPRKIGPMTYEFMVEMIESLN
ncbi:redoxin domain-containing protein [Virgibacillus byunsanensis]|uniref:Redoxin domain-containing protein n=1 Tax=Virgibacillus byunsanensis TaxID=570945 RepID=A0ABW3LHM0_9BACI